jgi:hypothetical protein
MADISFICITELFRIKFLRIGEVVWVMVEGINGYENTDIWFQGVTWFSRQCVCFDAFPVCQHRRRI